MKENEKGLQPNKKGGGGRSGGAGWRRKQEQWVYNNNVVFKEQEVSTGSIYYRTVRVDKDEKTLDLESSESLILYQQGKWKEQIEKLKHQINYFFKSIIWGENYLVYPCY